MHWRGLVIIPPDTVDMEKKVAELLAAFDHNLETEPHKRYFDPNSIDAFKQSWHTENLAEIVDHLQETGYGKYSYGVGLDEMGLYWITEGNDHGEWDYWTFSGGDQMIGEERWRQCLEAHHNSTGRDQPITCNMCHVRDLPNNFMMTCMVTPDGIWHDAVNFEHSSLWEDHFKHLLSLYPDHLAIGV